MLRSVNGILGYTIRATDGEIGTVSDLLFDDEHWTIRYFVVDTGGWLAGRLTLISPIAVTAISWQEQAVAVTLTQRQVEQSPDINTALPVSRQKELEYSTYYGYLPYWGGAGVWGMGVYPGTLAYPTPIPPVAPPIAPAPGGSGLATEQQAAPRQEHQDDAHLRSAREVIDYVIQAADGDLGHVEDFLMDDQSWTLHYMVVDTRNWWPGKKVLVAPRHICAVTWARKEVRVELPRETIKDAPEFNPDAPVDPAFEVQLQAYYQQHGV